MRVLVLDGRQRSALAVVRSLGHRGVELHVADSEAPTLAGVSRYTHSQLRCPDPQTQPARFVTWVHETARELHVDRVLPITDMTTMLLAGARGDGPYRMLCAPLDAYERVTDKHRLLETARRAGLPVPETVAVNTLAEMEERCRNARYPLVLKPARSRVLIGDRIVDTGVYVARSLREALDYARAQSWLGVIPCLLQEYIEGHGAGIFALYSDGRPVAWFSHRRVREKPPRGGISVLSESVAVDEGLRKVAERLLSEAQWDGVAMVEFRVDAQGTPYLMEVNGRLWGSLQLAIDSGVDFPWLMLRASTGERLESLAGYRLGCRLRWFLGDVDNLLLELRGRGIARTVGRKLGAVLSFIGTTFEPGVRNEILRGEDPRPAWLELRRWLKRI
jgi:predicted ATP-grasp superfamily ATP-dependent carboligase